MSSDNRRFIVTSTILGDGVIDWGSDFDVTFTAEGSGRVLRWTWRIVAAQSPAKWHKEQREEYRAQQDGFYGDSDDVDDEDDDAEDDSGDVQDDFIDPAPDAKWITFVTDEGEVLGFRIKKEM